MSPYILYVKPVCPEIFRRHILTNLAEIIAHFEVFSHHFQTICQEITPFKLLDVVLHDIYREQKIVTK